MKNWMQKCWGILENILKPKKPGVKLPVKEEIPSGPSLNDMVTLGAHMYRRAGDRSEIIFRYPEKGIYRTIVDNDGNIQDFPGIEEGDWINDMNEGSLKPVVRFRTSFIAQPDGGFLMDWQVQPDGRYWEDEDGFGGTSDCEIHLYTYINNEGKFTGPFRFYR